MSKNRPQPIFKRTEIVTDQKSLPPQEQDQVVDDADDGSVKQVASSEQPQADTQQADTGWSEIQAADLKEQATEPQVTQPEVVQAAPVPPVVQTTPAVAAAVPITPQPVNKAMKPLFNTVTTYAETMDPSKAITEEAGGRAQYALYRVIRDTLATPDYAAFKASWSTLLGCMLQMKDTVFNENVVYRHAGSFTGGEMDFAIYRRVIWVMLQTMDPQKRRNALVNVNMDKAMEGLTAVERENLINFYGA